MVRKININITLCPNHYSGLLPSYVSSLRESIVLTIFLKILKEKMLEMQYCQKTLLTNFKFLHI